MISFSSDFECGNGKHFESIGQDRYRMEVVGDKPTYCYYYCFNMKNGGPAADVTVEVWHDPVVNDVPGFISHFPSTVWLCPEGFGRYYPLDQTRTETHDDHIVFHLRIEAGQTIRVTDMWPAPYSETCEFLRTLAAEGADRCEVFSPGMSVQGREVLGLRAGTPGKPRVLCIAGQHPIEFSGTFAMRAIADYVSSIIPSAEALRQQFEFEVIPVVNPDGNVIGRNGFNAEGLDMYLTFGAEHDAPEPQAHESRLLWGLATERPLALWMNIHNYLGWRTNSEPPFDGWYAVADEVFSDPTARRLSHALCDTMRLETDGPSTHMVAAPQGAYSMCYQLASRCNVPSAFYEINGGTGGAFQSAKRGLAFFKAVMATMAGRQ